MTVSDSNECAPGGSGASSRLRVSSAWSRWVLVGVVTLPIVVAVVRAILDDWQPVGDVGLLALRADDVGGAHHPWLGSRTSAADALVVEVNHPGPWYSYLVAPFLVVFGLDIGIPLAVGVINIGSVVGIAVAARSLGGAACERWMLVAAAALSWTMGSELLVDLWQPHALMIPCLLLVVLASGVAAGRARFLPAFTALTCFVVQTHIGYSYVLVIIVSIAVASAFVVRHRSPSDERWSRSLQWSAAWAVVMWLPAIAEQLIEGRRGNLGRLLSNSKGSGVRIGAEQATEMTARLFAIPPFWSRGSFSNAIPNSGLQPTPGGTVVRIAGLPALGVSIVGLCLFCVLTAALLVFANRTGRVDQRGALVIVVAVVGASLVAISVIAVGPAGFGTHYVRWIFVFAAFSHAVLAWVAVTWIAERFGSRPSFDRTPLLAVTVLVILALPSHAQETGPVQDRWARPTLRSIDAQLGTISIPDPVVYELLGSVTYEPYSGPVMLWLARDGVDFRVRDEENIRQVGSSRAADGTETGVLYQRLGASALFYDGDDCVVLTADAMSDADRDRVSGRVSEITRRLVAGEVTFDAERLVSEPAFVDVLDAIRFGDDAKLGWHVSTGTLSTWADLGALDPATADYLADYGPDIAIWTQSAFGLYLHTDGPCPEMSRS